MDVIRVRAPSNTDAQRLVAALDGEFAISLDGDGMSEVGLTLDADTATRLVFLFDALGRWLNDGGLAGVEIGFGERTYTLLAPSKGKHSDPSDFLLERTIQLQTALISRVVIEQAKGILAEREGITPDEAFEKMRRQARNRRMKLHDLAAGIVSTISRTAEKTLD
jgi:ANTAR domain